MAKSSIVYYKIQLQDMQCTLQDVQYRLQDVQYKLQDVQLKKYLAPKHRSPQKVNKKTGLIIEACFFVAQNSYRKVWMFK